MLALHMHIGFRNYNNRILTQVPVLEFQPTIQWLAFLRAERVGDSSHELSS